MPHPPINLEYKLGLNLDFIKSCLAITPYLLSSPLIQCSLPLTLMSLTMWALSLLSMTDNGSGNGDLGACCLTDNYLPAYTNFFGSSMTCYWGKRGFAGKLKPFLRVFKQ